MLTSLSIRNLVLIEALDLSFEAGLTTLTGETGAGKSILLVSLGLALGGRSDARFIRHGAERAQRIGQLRNRPPAIRSTPCLQTRIWTAMTAS